MCYCKQGQLLLKMKVFVKHPQSLENHMFCTWDDRFKFLCTMWLICMMIRYRHLCHEPAPGSSDGCTTNSEWEERIKRVQAKKGSKYKTCCEPNHWTVININDRPYIEDHLRIRSHGSTHHYTGYTVNLEDGFTWTTPTFRSSNSWDPSKIWTKAQMILVFVWDYK